MSHKLTELLVEIFLFLLSIVGVTLVIIIVIVMHLYSRKRMKRTIEKIKERRKNEL
jgi:hypothetical protein